MTNEITKIRSSEQWRNYVREASKMEIDAILEKAKRIDEFHQAFLENKNKFGKIWSHACDEILRINQTTCDRYIKIFHNLSPQIMIDNKQYLPTSIESLVAIAKASEIHSDTIVKAIEDKIIFPDMTSEKANELIVMAKDNVRHDAVQLIEMGYDDKFIIEKTNIDNEDIPQLRETFEERKKHDIYNLMRNKFFNYILNFTYENEPVNRSIIDNLIKEFLGYNPKGVLK